MRVAVIGAGVGGATLAVALHRAGVAVSVHERAGADTRSGNGLGLSANGIRVLDGLGLAAALRRIGAPIPAMALRDADGADISRYDVGAGGLLGVRRADLTRMLTGAVPGDAVHRGHDCVAVHLGEHTATAEFADGTRVEADVVVGADGLRSTVADHVTRRPPLRDSGRVALRGFVPGAGLPPGVADGQIAWLGPDRHLLTYPVGRDGTLVIAGFVPRAAVGAGGAGALVAAFDGWDADVRSVVGRAEAVSAYELADRDPFAPWCRGRVCLLGDAAHPMLPHAGQGANQAIEDAAVLAAVVAASRPRDVPAAVAAYEAARRPRTTRVQDRSRRNGEAFSGGAATRPGTDAAPDLSWLHAHDALAVARDVAARVRASTDPTNP